VEGCAVSDGRFDAGSGWTGGGTGNIDADPLFVDADGPDDIPGTEDDDLRLLPGSPCIDAGDNTAVPADTADLDGDGDTTEPVPLDLDGNPRIMDDPSTVDTGNGTPPIVDMGACEYAPGLPGDADGDGDVDIFDTIALVNAFGTCQGEADYDPRCDFDGNGCVDVFDVIVLVNNFGRSG